MRIKQYGSEWWIVEVKDLYDCGPYETKKEAIEGMQGLDRLFKYIEAMGFFCSEPLKHDAR